MVEALGFVNSAKRSSHNIKLMQEMTAMLILPDANPSDPEENKVLVINLKDFLWAILRINHSEEVDNPKPMEYGGVRVFKFNEKG